MKKTVLVTGASSGSGKATAKLFASEGWNVVYSASRQHRKPVKAPPISRA